jgi:hypothetical protein
VLYNEAIWQLPSGQFGYEMALLLIHEDIAANVYDFRVAVEGGDPLISIRLNIESALRISLSVIEILPIPRQ